MSQIKKAFEKRVDPEMVGFGRQHWRIAREQYLRETGRLDQLRAERARDRELAARAEAKRAKGASA